MFRFGFAVALGFALTACSGTSTPGDTGPATDLGVDSGVTDTGTTTVDAGVEDTGPIDTGPVTRDCRLNPFDCAENQVMSPSCRCEGFCTGGLVFNPNLSECVTPPLGECLTDSDCPIRGDVCLDFPTNGGIARCEDAATCRCAIPCNPFVRRESTGCPANDQNGDLGCTWLGNPDLPTGLCLRTGIGFGQGERCPRTTECNRQSNFFCIGGGTTGRCARLCDVQDQQLCNDLGNWDCVDLQDENLPGIGLCRDPVPPVFDLGQSCGGGQDCDGGLCSTILSNSCSYACGGLISCPADSLCVTFNGANLPPGEEAICMPTCSGPNATGDQACGDKNPALICRQLIAAPSPALCSPPCTFIGCAPNTTCNPGTGRCE